MLCFDAAEGQHRTIDASGTFKRSCRTAGFGRARVAERARARDQRVTRARDVADLLARQFVAAADLNAQPQRLVILHKCGIDRHRIAQLKGKKAGLHVDFFNNFSPQCFFASTLS